MSKKQATTKQLEAKYKRIAAKESARDSAASKQMAATRAHMRSSFTSGDVAGLVGATVTSSIRGATELGKDVLSAIELARLRSKIAKSRKRDKQGRFV